jgi:hypothetical protein
MVVAVLVNGDTQKSLGADVQNRKGLPLPEGSRGQKRDLRILPVALQILRTIRGAGRRDRVAEPE